MELPRQRRPDATAQQALVWWPSSLCSRALYMPLRSRPRCATHPKQRASWLACTQGYTFRKQSRATALMRCSCACRVEPPAACRSHVVNCRGSSALWWRMLTACRIKAAQGFSRACLSGRAEPLSVQPGQVVPAEQGSSDQHSTTVAGSLPRSEVSGQHQCHGLDVCMTQVNWRSRSL